MGSLCIQQQYATRILTPFLIVISSDGGIRTHNPFRAANFKSAVYTSSTTSPQLLVVAMLPVFDQITPVVPKDATGKAEQDKQNVLTQDIPFDEINVDRASGGVDSCMPPTLTSPTLDSYGVMGYVKSSDKHYDFDRHVDSS